MSNPLVSVYITNYNYERYIRQAILSVLGQSFQNFELFIIDDGSTDNSKEIIESCSKNEKITIIYQKNKGLNITNNIALRLSKGKYIIRLDADDYLEPSALEEMVLILENNSELGMVFPDYFLVDQSNTVLAEVKRLNFDEEVSLFDQPAHGACTMIRTSFLNDVGGYDESYSCQDGYELWIKFSTKFKVSNIKKPLFYYRQHGENLTSNENRILGTRRDINLNFVRNQNLNIPKTIAIIPVRNLKIGSVSLPFLKLGTESFIDIKIKQAMKLNDVLAKVVVTSDSDEVEQYVLSNYGNVNKIIFLRRTREMARYNVSLVDTINYILNYPKIEKICPEVIMILPLEFPFADHVLMQDALHSLTIFNSDSVISVRREYSTFYQHHGGGMVPILNQDSFTRLERESLYRGIGAITLAKTKNFIEKQKLLVGKVGHISLDQKSCLAIKSNFDVELINLIYSKETEALQS